MKTIKTIDYIQVMNTAFGQLVDINMKLLSTGAFGDITIKYHDVSIKAESIIKELQMDAFKNNYDLILISGGNPFKHRLIDADRFKQSSVTQFNAIVCPHLRRWYELHNLFFPTCQDMHFSYMETFNRSEYKNIHWVNMHLDYNATIEALNKVSIDPLSELDILEVCGLNGTTEIIITPYSFYYNTHGEYYEPCSSWAHPDAILSEAMHIMGEVY